MNLITVPFSSAAGGDVAAIAAQAQPVSISHSSRGVVERRLLQRKHYPQDGAMALTGAMALPLQ